MTDVDARSAHRTDLGRAVRALRIARGLTVRRLAGALGVSAATLSAIENGRTGVSTARVAALAAALDVPVQRLLTPGAGEVGTVPPRVPVAPVTPMAVTAPPGHWRVFEPLELPAALGGALASFLEFGYHGATMRTIAERAGLSVPGLYHHHASKQEMLVAILDLTMTDLVARTAAARAEGTDAVSRFALLVECLALFHTHRRDLGFVGYSEMRSLEPGAHARVAAVRRGVQHLVDAEVEDAVRLGAFATDRPHEAARAVVTMTTAMPQWFRPDGPASAEDVAAQHVRFALDLVRHSGPGGPTGVPTIDG